MRDNIRFSINIPTYNRGPQLIYTIESVLSQTYTNFELNILDDSTNDETSDLINKLNDPRIKYFKNSPKLGLVKNWNRCLTIANFEYILILHHDDILLVDALANYAKFISENEGAKFIHANAYSASLPYFKKFNFNITQKSKVLKFGNEALLKIMSEHNFACSSVIMHKSVINESGLFDEDCWVSPDYEYYARVATRFSIYHLDEPTAVFVLHENNTHRIGYNVEEFIRDNEVYRNKIRNYLSGDKTLDLNKDNETYLDDALIKIGNNYFIAGNYKKALAFFRASSIKNKAALIFKALNQKVKHSFKRFFFRKVDFKQLFIESAKLRNSI